MDGIRSAMKRTSVQLGLGVEERREDSPDPCTVDKETGSAAWLAWHGLS